MSRCTCCDLPIESCGAEVERRQRGELAARRAAWLTQPRVIAASFPDTCSGCGERVAVGDPIRRAGPTDRWGQWRGLLCCGGTP